MKMVNKSVDKTLYLVCHWSQYSGDNGEWILELQSWEPSDESNDFLLETFVVSRSITMTHDELVNKQLRKYDTKERELNREFGVEMAVVNDQRQQLLALPDLSNNVVILNAEDDGVPF